MDNNQVARPYRRLSMHFMSLKMTTSLSVEECLQRLQIALKPSYRKDQTEPWSPLVGSVRSTRFRASKRRRFTHNMFEPIFFRTVTADKHRTMISGHFHMNLPVILFLIVCAIPFVYEAIRTWSLLPVSTLPIIYSLVLIIHLASLPNKRLIRDNLLRILEAQELPVSPWPTSESI
jgi:hypothetical protein